jgi:hypothetical protein
MSVSELSLSSSGTPGDHAHFFDGDVLRKGAGDGCKSLTRMYATLFPHRVCVVVTSNRSDFDLESLIFGIERIVYAGMVAQSSKKMKMEYRQCNQFNVFATGGKVLLLPYPWCASAGQG